MFDFLGCEINQISILILLVDQITNFRSARDLLINVLYRSKK